MLSGPTSAKNPILLTFVILASITSPLNCGERAGTYGFEHDGLVPAAALGMILPCPTSKIETTLMI